MRLGLIGSTDSKRTSGVYCADDTLALQNAKKYVSRFSYDGVFNALGSSDIEEAFDVSRDGRYVYVVVRGTRTTAAIFQYECTTPWDLSTIVYSSKSLIVGDYDTGSNGIAISDDGTRLFFSGFSVHVVWSCTLSTPYDLATATVDVKQVYVGTQDATCSTPVFGDSGTKMYVMGGTNDTVYQYTLSTAWDVSTATYASKSLSVTTLEATPQGLFLNDDGTKIYVTGSTNDIIISYTLSTAWDVSTGIADYSAKSFSVATQVPAAAFSSIYIGDNGTKMYALSGDTAATDTIFQYTLSTAWNVSTAVYASKSFVVNTQDLTTSGLFFKTDGTKLYVTGNTNDIVVSYSLSTAWDVSTCTADYSAKSFSVATQVPATAFVSTFIGDNGTKIYALSGGAAATDTIFQYTLSTAWDVSTATYASKSLVVNTRDTTTQGIFFKTDGTKLYVIGATNDTIYQYTLSTAWDISTASYDTVSFSVAAQEITPTGLYIDSSGTRMYVTGSTGDDVNQYTLSTAWNISTATFVRVSAAVGDTVPEDVFFKDDGTKMYIIGSTGDAIREFTLSTAWDVSTIAFTRAYPVGYLDALPTSVFFKSDGTEVYISGNTNRVAYQLSLSVAWDSGTAIGRFYVGNEEITPTGLYIDNSGTRMYVTGSTGDDVNQYSLSTAWNISTATFVRVSAAVGDASPNDIFFKDDGTIMYIIGTTGDTIREFTLSTAWDVSTIAFTRACPVGHLDINPSGIFFKGDGTEVYIAGYTNRVAYQLSLSVAWSSRSVKGRFYVGNEETEPRAIFIKPDGLKMYLIGATGDDVNEYNLSTAWDISTATFLRVSANLGMATPTGMWFKDDGTIMYIASSGEYYSEKVYIFTLSSAWDVSTVNFSTYSLFSVGLNSVLMTGVTFKSDGTKMYITRRSGAVYEFQLSAAWSLENVKGHKYVGDWKLNIRGIDINSDGTLLSLSGNETNGIVRFELITPYELGTGYMRDSTNCAGYSVQVAADGLKIYATADSSNNLPAGGRQIRQITMTTPNDLTTATLNTTTEMIPIYGLTGACSELWGVRVSPDGTRMFVLSDNVQGMYQFSLRFA